MDVWLLKCAIIWQPDSRFGGLAIIWQPDSRDLWVPFQAQHWHAGSCEKPEVTIKWESVTAHRFVFPDTFIAKFWTYDLEDMGSSCTLECLKNDKCVAYEIFDDKCDLSHACSAMDTCAESMHSIKLAGQEYLCCFAMPPIMLLADACWNS
jgi:hypothetical protein